MNLVEPIKASFYILCYFQLGYLEPTPDSFCSFVEVLMLPV